MKLLKLVEPKKRPSLKERKKNLQKAIKVANKINKNSKKMK
ncbi:hypothetical protein AB0Y20_01540 [Heyndrickxia oleronia]